MNLDARSVDVGAYALLVGSALGGLLLWPSLPGEMAIHFGTSGQPDNYVAKPVGIVLAPLIGIAAILVTRYAPEWSSRRYHSPEVETVTIGFLAVVVTYVQGFVYVWNLGYRVRPSLVVAPVLIGAGLLVAYAYTR